jgi:hypothetical protein
MGTGVREYGVWVYRLGLGIDTYTVVQTMRIENYFTSHYIMVL